jgi:hypothetical protein
MTSSTDHHKSKQRVRLDDDDVRSHFVAVSFLGYVRRSVHTLEYERAYNMQNQLHSMSEHSRFTTRTSSMPDSNTPLHQLRQMQLMTEGNNNSSNNNNNNNGLSQTVHGNMQGNSYNTEQLQSPTMHTNQGNSNMAEVSSSKDPQDNFSLAKIRD